MLIAYRPASHGTLSWRLHAGLFALLFLHLTADAETLRFVHLSDPHLFDENKRGEATVYNEPWNWAVFEQTIAEINEVFDIYSASEDENNLQFVAVTGDLGLESLIKVADKKKLSTPLTHEQYLQLPQVDRLLKLIRACKVKRWFFLPGNNDLDDERARTVNFYTGFIEALEKNLGLINNDPDDTRVRDLSRISYRPPNSNYAFFGLDNASFKNDNNARVYWENEEQQKANLEALNDRIDALFEEEKAPKYVFLFYHTPEVDDPHNIDFAEKKPGAVYPYSAWFVPKEDPELYKTWHGIISRPRVAALFAGHFHTAKRERYMGFSWLSKGHVYPAIEKLFIAPPLSLKYQNDVPDTARGFQVIQISAPDPSPKKYKGTNTFRKDGGNIHRTVYWYNAGREDWVVSPAGWPDPGLPGTPVVPPTLDSAKPSLPAHATIALDLELLEALYAAQKKDVPLDPPDRTFFTGIPDDLKWQIPALTATLILIVCVAFAVPRTAWAIFRNTPEFPTLSDSDSTGGSSNTIET